MNLLHRWYCGSSRWAALVEGALLPWALEGVALGAELLELGPGPGVTTEVLRRRVARLTAVELDAALAARLARRLPRPGV
jgi:protein-L-isoaspartate O-methyltransferase